MYCEWQVRNDSHIVNQIYLRDGGVNDFEGGFYLQGLRSNYLKHILNLEGE
jgi:hypothetical protein